MTQELFVPKVSLTIDKYKQVGQYKTIIQTCKLGEDTLKLVIGNKNINIVSINGRKKTSFTTVDFERVKANLEDYYEDLRINAF